LARTPYIRCIYGIFGRETCKYAVIYGGCIRRPTLSVLLTTLFPVQPCTSHLSTAFQTKNVLRVNTVYYPLSYPTLQLPPEHRFLDQTFGQNPIYTVHIRYLWQGNLQICGHIQWMYTTANPISTAYYPLSCPTLHLPP